MSKQILETKVIERLLVPLTQQQAAASGEMMATTMQQITALNDKRRAFLEAHKESMKPLQETLDICVQEFTDGREADVECSKRVDVAKRRVTVTRSDTGEIVEDREATAADLQTELEV